MAKPVLNTETTLVYPKCGHSSGDDWSQCEYSCPVDKSPFYKEETFKEYGDLVIQEVPVRC